MDLDENVKQIWGKSIQDIINYMFEYDGSGYELHNRVLQFKYTEKTLRISQNLVWATWGLVAITALLVVVTIIVTFYK